MIRPARPSGSLAGDDAVLRTYVVRVLGCKVNQYEAQQIAQMLESSGLRPAENPAAADLAVVHTCAVTGTAVRKSAQLARRLAGDARCLILTGCAGNERDWADDLPIAGVVGPGPDWPAQLEALLETLPLPALPPATVALDRFRGHTRAFLKIQDGCNLNCSYCIVPSLRGPPRDRPMAEIVAEAGRLARNGHRELVISGVSVGLWGQNAGRTLADVLPAVAAVPGVERLRLSSLHPAELTDDLLAAWRATPAMMPHVHLPLQSGSTRILRAMNRGYSADQFLAAIARARAALDRPAFNTDILVGFPGETGADFEDTLRVSRAAGFSRMHIFPFSPRPGTPAASLPDPVPPAVMNERVRRLRNLADELQRAAHAAAAGGDARVLCETRTTGGEWEGYSERYYPVRFAGPPEWAGRLARVHLDRVNGPRLQGTAGGEDLR